MHTARLLPSSIVIRLNSTNKIPIRNLPNINDEEEEDDDDDRSKKVLSSKDYIFADSKSSRFKEKNPRKQKQWLKELEQRKIIPKTPLSSFIKETQTTPEKIKQQDSDNKIIRDKYVTPDGIMHENTFQINFDTDLDEDEQEKEPDEPIS
ncbi:unnamed protein product, partial [Rotaria sp. Silwood2]